MQIEIKIDEKCKEPKIIVMTDKMTDEVNAIIKRLSDEQPQVIAGFREDVVEVLEPSEIYRVFAASGKVFAETNHGEYALRLRLYEVEERLDSKTFVLRSENRTQKPALPGHCCVHQVRADKRQMPLWHQVCRQLYGVPLFLSRPLYGLVPAVARSAF